MMSSSTSSCDGQLHTIDDRVSGLLQLVKMLAVVAIPAIALVIVCSLQLSSAIQGYDAADVATGAFQEFLRLDKLVTGVQLERGMSAAWVSSRGTNVAARNKLTLLWAENDGALQSLSDWPPSGLRVAAMTYQTPRQLHFHINSLRGIVISGEVTFTDEITEYTAITNALMTWSLTVIVQSDMTTIWSMIVSNSALLLASDMIGIQRALGSVFYTCIDEFTEKETKWFFENEGAANALLSFASSLNDDVSLMYTEQYVDSPLHKNISSLKFIVGGMDARFNCSSINITQRFETVEFWKVGFHRIF